VVTRAKGIRKGPAYPPLSSSLVMRSGATTSSAAVAWLHPRRMRRVTIAGEIGPLSAAGGLTRLSIARNSASANYGPARRRLCRWRGWVGRARSSTWSSCKFFPIVHLGTALCQAMDPQSWGTRFSAYQAGWAASSNSAGARSSPRAYRPVMRGTGRYVVTRDPCHLRHSSQQEEEAGRGSRHGGAPISVFQHCSEAESARSLSGR
jgi:hypothetical protein